MTSNNETVPSQNLWAGNIGKFRMSEGNSALLLTNVDWWRPLQQIFNGFPASKFPSIQISYRLDPRETGNFVSFESGNKINGVPWDQSFNKCLMFSTTQPYSSLVFIETFSMETNLVNRAYGLTECMCLQVNFYIFLF